MARGKPRMRLLIVFVFSAFLVAQNGETPPELSVCELLKNPAKLNRRVLALRGEYLPGAHALYLAGIDLQSKGGPYCDNVLRTKGKSWQSVVLVVNSREETEARGFDHRKFVNTLNEIHLASIRASRRYGRNAKVARITVTFVGWFETRDSFDGSMDQREGQGPGEHGFGDQDTAPGQMFVESVKDIVVEFEGN